MTKAREMAASRLPDAVRIVADIGEAHAVKAVLGLQRLAARFPEWDELALGALWRRSQFELQPRVTGLLGDRVGPLSIEYGQPRRERVISRGLFPLAYRLAQEWADEAGVAAVIGHYRRRAIQESGYLGHGFSIWLSFVEAEPLLQNPLDRALLLERFVEFAAKAYPGFPTSDSTWTPPRRQAVRGIDWDFAFQCALRRPGFFGHHLITLAAARRAQPQLDGEEWPLLLDAIFEMTMAPYTDPDDNLAVPLHLQPATLPAAAEWPQVLHCFAMRLPPNLHVITLTDALATLWDAATDTQRRGLLAAMAALAPAGA